MLTICFFWYQISPILIKSAVNKLIITRAWYSSRARYLCWLFSADMLIITLVFRFANQYLGLVCSLDLVHHDQFGCYCDVNICMGGINRIETRLTGNIVWTVWTMAKARYIWSGMKLISFPLLCGWIVCPTDISFDHTSRRSVQIGRRRCGSIPEICQHFAFVTDSRKILGTAISPFGIWCATYHHL